jgi:hypothetical protein
MAHVESKRYDAGNLPALPTYELISAWLTGERYRIGQIDVATQENSPTEPIRSN